MLRLAAATALFALLSLAGWPATQEQNLYTQATAAMLARDFSEQNVDYLLLDVRTRQTIAMRWPRAQTAMPVGSLMKPFVALAFAEVHWSNGSDDSDKKDFFPAVICHGKSDGCWRTGGHGAMHLEIALAQSCNAYFLALARAISISGQESQPKRDSLRNILQVYGLPAPPRMDDTLKIPGMLIGVTPEWRVPPVDLARAYAELATGHPNATTKRLLTGMQMAALPGGTAALAGTHAGGILAKTGTAPCIPSIDAVNDRCRANGDGLVVLMTPVDAPKLLLLVRERGTTGAMAAQLAGRMLARIEALDAAR